MKKTMILALLALFVCNSVAAAEIEKLKSLAKMKIHEITVFKDGHVFVQHSGKMPVGPTGKVVMDYLPSPVLGTYWPYSLDSSADLRAVTAGKRKLLVEKTALSIPEMIEANIGARVFITERVSAPNSQESPNAYEATLLEIPTRSGEELESLMPSSSNEKLPEKAKVVLVKTDKGVKVLEFARILDITFTGERKSKVKQEEFRNLLTLDLKWQGEAQRQAEVGMIYLQKGIRWIPSYKLMISEDKKVALKLEATLINELTDIEDATAHLVVGVPSFAFKDSIDPISLQKEVARLSGTFQRNNRTSSGFSNAIMSQVAAAPMESSNNQVADAGMFLGPELGGSSKTEDLYMFTVNHISLDKGERMVLPIAEYDLSYEDVYTLDIPFTPPMEVVQGLGHSERMDLMHLQTGPKVQHKIRITNNSKHPFTTAPAMIMKDNRLLAQGMMKYTPIGSDSDIEMTTAVDIKVKKIDNELQRTPDAFKWHNDRYTRIDLEGKITLISYKDKPVSVEITRHVLGNIDSVDNSGKKEMVNPFEDNSYLPDIGRSSWWYGYSWPWWWYQFNGIGRIKWTTTLQPAKPADHTYRWHYLWR